MMKSLFLALAIAASYTASCFGQMDCYTKTDTNCLPQLTATCFNASVCQMVDNVPFCLTEQEINYTLANYTVSYNTHSTDGRLLVEQRPVACFVKSGCLNYCSLQNNTGMMMLKCSSDDLSNVVPYGSIYLEYVLGPECEIEVRK